MAEGSRRPTIHGWVPTAATALAGIALALTLGLSGADAQQGPHPTAVERPGNFGSDQLLRHALGPSRVPDTPFAPRRTRHLPDAPKVEEVEALVGKKISAAIESSSVAGNRRMNSSSTARPVSMELPKLPLSSRPIQVKYWTMTGSLNP